MHLITEAYLTQLARWPKSGQHILAQYDDSSVVVYQAYRPSIGHFAAQHGYFGGGFSFSRMSWIKPGFFVDDVSQRVGGEAGAGGGAGGADQAGGL